MALLESILESDLADVANGEHPIDMLVIGSDSEGVTDTYGRFWRYQNLWAADASSWPSQGTVNSSPPITAVALRQAENLAEIMKTDGEFNQ